MSPRNQRGETNHERLLTPGNRVMERKMGGGKG